MELFQGAAISLNFSIYRNTSLVVWARTGAHMANQPWMLPFIGHVSAHGRWLAPLCLNFYNSCSCWEGVVSSSVRPIPAKITAIIMWWWCESFRFVSITVSGIFLKWWVQLQLMKSRLDIPSVQQNKELGFLRFQVYRPKYTEFWIIYKFKNKFQNHPS